MEIALGIPENVINKITEGMLVDVSFASIENTFKAKVTEASPALDVNTATYPVRVTIVNPSDEKKVVWLPMLLILMTPLMNLKNYSTNDCSWRRQ